MYSVYTSLRRFMVTHRLEPPNREFVNLFLVSVYPYCDVFHFEIPFPYTKEAYSPFIVPSAF